MSSTNKTANYQLSQFVGTDIPSILNDYNGDMRKIDSAIKDASVAGGDNATAIAELQTSTNRLATEVGGINSTVNSLSGRVLGIEEVVPATATEDNKLVTQSDIENIGAITELQEEVSDISGDVKAIQLCVPANASENNKLATMNDIEHEASESGLFCNSYNVNVSGLSASSTFADLCNLIYNAYLALKSSEEWSGSEDYNRIAIKFMASGLNGIMYPHWGFEHAMTIGIASSGAEWVMRYFQIDWYTNAQNATIVSINKNGTNIAKEYASSDTLGSLETDFGIGIPVNVALLY